MDVSKHVEKAEEAVRKKNYPYAAQLLLQVIQLKPDHGEAYALLCRAYREQAQRKKTPGWLAKVAGSPLLLSSGVGKLGKNPAARARSLTKYLKLEPENPSVLQGLGEALAEAGFMNAAVSVFEAWAQAEPRNGDAWRMAAACHAQVQSIDQALECLEKAIEANPRDAEAERMRKNLAADSTLRQGAYDSAGSSRDLIKDKEQARRLQREERLHRSDDEQAEEEVELQGTLADNPGDGRARRRLAEILAGRKDYEGALKTLEDGLDHDDNAGDLQDRIGDFKLAAIDREIRKLEARRAEEDSDGLREDLKMLQEDRLAIHAAEARRRVEARPTELGLWYELGKAQQQAGELDEAIAAFQKSIKDPKTRLDSMSRLASCFHKKGLYDLAEKQLKAALEETSPSSDRGKGVLYNLGVIAEKAGRPQDAFGYFTQIYEVDIAYRDVSEKIEALRGS